MLQNIKNGYVGVIISLIIILAGVISWQNYLLKLGIDKLNENLQNTNHYVIQLLNQQRPVMKINRDPKSEGYLTIFDRNQKLKPPPGLFYFESPPKPPRLAAGMKAKVYDECVSLLSVRVSLLTKNK